MFSNFFFFLFTALFFFLECQVCRKLVADDKLKQVIKNPFKGPNKPMNQVMGRMDLATNLFFRDFGFVQKHFLQIHLFEYLANLCLFLLIFKHFHHHKVEKLFGLSMS